MDYYKYDKEKRDKIKELNEKISKEQQQIFDILLKISQSFSNERVSKEERNKLFCEVDILKQNIKDHNEKLKEVKSEEYDCNIIESKETVENKSFEKTVKQVEKLEKKNEAFIDTAQKLEDTLKENEVLEEKKITSQDSKEDNLAFSKRKKARTQLVVIDDDDDSVSGKIKDFFKKLKSFMKK